MRDPLPRLLHAGAALTLVLSLVSPRSVQAAEPATDPARVEAQPTTAAAEPESSTDAPDPGDEMKAKAMEAYGRGESSYEEGKYEEALAAFQEASSFYASPEFQYNIGRCYENLERYEDAVRSYEIYLRAKPNAGDSGDVRERIGRLRGLLEAKKNEPEPTPTAVDPSGPSEPVTSVDQGPAKPGKPLVISGAVLLGVGAAVGLGGGIGFGVAAGTRSDELDEIQTGGNPDDQTLADAQDVQDRGKNAEIGQIAMAAGGAAIAIGGVVLLTLGFLKNKKARGSATLMPTMTRRSAGLTLTGRF